MTPDRQDVLQRIAKFRDGAISADELATLREDIAHSPEGKTAWAELLVQGALHHSRLGQYELGGFFARQALQVNPASGAANEVLAIILAELAQGAARKGEWPEVIALLQERTRLRRLDDSLLALLAVAHANEAVRHYNARDVAEAVISAKISRVIDPGTELMRYILQASDISNHIKNNGINSDLHQIQQNMDALYSIKMRDGDFEGALSLLKISLDLAVDDRHARHLIFYKIGFCLLCLGRFDEARQSLIDWTATGAAGRNIKIWQGEELTDKTLLIHCDQGQGDIINFIRYAAPMAKLCRKVMFIVPDHMKRLVGPDIHFFAQGDQFDFYSTLFMVPHVLGLDYRAIPGEVPYLRAEPALVEFWRRRLPDGGVRVGVVWKGGPFDSQRSIALRCLAPIARLDGVTLISLQMYRGLKELNHLPDDMKVHVLGPDYNAGEDQFVDTAAVIANLDLVISIDTSVAHLCGALGHPVWLLLKAVPDWRWQQSGETSPWYPSMRIFRQTNPGDWDEVVARVARQMIALRDKRAESRA